MDLLKKGSGKRKRIANDSLMSEPVKKIAKYKQCQYIHKTNLSPEQNKSVLTNQKTNQEKIINMNSNDEPTDDPNFELLQTNKSILAKPEILVNTIQYITNNISSDEDEEIDVVNVDELQESQTILEANENLDTIELKTKKKTTLNKNSPKSKVKHKLVKPVMTLAEGMQKLFSPTSKFSKNKLNNNEINSNNDEFKTKKGVNNNKNSSDEVLNNMCALKILSTKNKSVVDVEVKTSLNSHSDKSFTNTKNIDDFVILSNVKVVLDRNIVDNYFKTKQAKNAKIVSSLIKTNENHQSYQFSNHQYTNSKSNKKNQKQTTMLNFFNTKNAAVTEFVNVEKDSIKKNNTPDSNGNKDNSPNKKILNDKSSLKVGCTNGTLTKTEAKKVFYVMDNSSFDLFINSPSEAAKIPDAEILKSPKEPKFLFCNDCDYKTNKGKHRIRNHIQNKHPEEFNKNRVAECSQCGRKFSKISYLRDHKLVCGLVPHLKCKFCPERLKYKSTLQTHLIKFHSNEMKKVNLEELLNETVKEGTLFKANALKAAKRGEEIPKVEILNLSKVECKLNEDGQPQCWICDMTFKRVHYLKLHQTTCGLAHLKCPYCSSKFKYKSGIQKHFLRKHKNIIDSTEFDAILKKIINEGKSFKEKARKLSLDGIVIPKVLKNTKTCTKGKIDLHCIQCKRSTPREYKKTNIKKCPNCKIPLYLQCVKCKKTYKTYEGIWEHLRSSCKTREHTIQCNDCNYTTYSKGKLIVHIQRRHTTIDPKDYVDCPECGKGFKNIHYMKYHKIHCGKSKDYCCKLCPWKTKYIYQLNKHIKMHKMHSKDQIPLTDDTKNSFINKSFGVNRAPKLEKLSVTIGNDKDMQVQIIDPTYLDNKKPSVKIEDLAIFECSNCRTIAPANNKPENCKKCNVLMPYKCKSCSRTYKNKDTFCTHLPTKCASPHIYQCEHCDRQFTIKDNVRRHIFAEHMTEIDANGYVQCPKCKKKYKGRNNMLKHSKNCGVKPKFKCAFCQIRSRYIFNLRKHMIRKHSHIGGKKIEDLLTKIYNEAKNMKKESNKNKMNKTKPDTLAKNNNLIHKPIIKNGFRVISIYLSKDEKKRVQHLILVRCPSCSKSYTVDKKKKDHKLIECFYCQTKNEFECMTCSKKYSRKRSIHKHIKREHFIGPDETNLHECSNCSKRFTFIESLREHWRICIYAMDLKCDSCGFSTKHKDSLRKHIKRKHMGIKITKNYECDKCGFKFANQGPLQKHMFNCNGGYKCDECAAKFRTKNALMQHIKLKKIN